MLHRHAQAALQPAYLVDQILYSNVSIRYVNFVFAFQCRKLRKEARTNMALNLDRAGLNHMYPEFFIVSSRVLYCHIVGKTLQSGWVEMDEQSLLEWLCRELKKRETT